MGYFDTQAQLYNVFNVLLIVFGYSLGGIILTSGSKRVFDSFWILFRE